MGKKPEIITVQDLKSYFYESLREANQAIIKPVPQETLFYSSDVLNKYCDSKEFFEETEGRVKNKILGEKLLTASTKPFSEQKRIYKDVADTSLFLCGYFFESVNAKLIDINYYKQIGESAYLRLNSLAPQYMDMPSFYNLMADLFNDVVDVISVVASKDKSDPQKHLLVG